MKRYEIAFVLEQALGHVTHAKNLQAYVPSDPEVSPHWALIDFKAQGLGGRVPIFRSNWSVRAGVRAQRALTKIARNTELDVLFFHTQVPAVLAQRWMNRIPSIVSLDATPIQYDQLGEFYQHKAGPAALEKIKWQLNRRCYDVARQIVVWADWTKRSLVDDYGVPADKITVIPPGVIVRDWVRPQPRTLEEGTVHKRTVKILFVGADFQRKGGGLLLDAFRALRTPSVELHIVTKDKVPVEPGLFVYNDMQPNSVELKRLYHACDIFVLPTRADCLPMVLSEAGAAELAVVSTTVAGIPEIVRHGTTGFTVAPGDPDALIDALKTLLENPVLRLEFASRARDHVNAAYNAETNSARLLGLLKAQADESKALSGGTQRTNAANSLT